jgi:branched-chain amino acid aminotransferase
MKVYIDGKFYDEAKAKVSVFDHGLLYGDGVFEGIRAYQSMNGVKIFKAQEHFERLKESCALIGIPFQYKTSDLIQIAYQLLQVDTASGPICRYLQVLTCRRRRDDYDHPCVLHTGNAGRA